MRDQVKQLLRGHLVPRLQAEASPAAWIHFVEAAVAFEEHLAEVSCHLVHVGLSTGGQASGYVPPWVGR